MDWSRIPDILAIVSLSCAFSSILRQNRTSAHRLWLWGWTMIGLHFVGFMVAAEPGLPGVLGSIVGLTTLVAAGICFMWATVPSEDGVSCRRMAVVIFLTTSLYILLDAMPNAPGWAFDLSAFLIALGPLTVGIFYRHYAQHTLRWMTVGLQFALGAELLVLRRQTGSPDLGVNAILFVIYLGCCVYFWYSHKSGTTGSIITIGGFLAWALVFVVSPAKDYYLPDFHIEGEVWNLPKYIVAIGMLMLLLEKQVERSQYLALHDDLTSLPNRRLFQDRLMSALERARRSGSSVALLQIDLDGFKNVNDTFGHHMGDLLLRHVAALLEARVRRSDTVARTGGDEFSVILEEAGRRETAASVAQMLGNLLSEPFTLAGKRIRIGASIGVAVFPNDADAAETLCIEADLRMYSRKQERRDVVTAITSDRREQQTVAG
jgi:diguanylate cyclase (GGDEF)-like protein